MEIKVKDLAFGYGVNAVLSVRDIAFEKGKAYGIVGPNGAGKTTFFKTLTNIITNYQGTVEINGINVKQDPSILGKVGIVLDDMSLYRNRTGMFNIEYFAGLRGGKGLEKAMELAKELQIHLVLDRKVAIYSLGMTKKLQLLISMMNDAEILIFDEPFRGLDQPTVEWFRNYLNQLKSQGKTILISSHIQEDIESICDIVYVLKNRDFQASFDLTDASQSFTYTLEPSNIEAFIEILTEANIAYKQNKDKIKFETTEDEYSKLFKQAVNADIEFSQIKKEVPFSDFVGVAK